MTRIHVAWLVAHVDDLKAAAKQWWARLTYRGVHRPGVERPEMLGWLDAHRLRAAAWIREHAEPVDFDHEHVEAVLREPTADMVVPDFESDVDDYRANAGVGRYAHLRIDELDATAERDQRRFGQRPVVDLEALKVRNPAPDERLVAA